MVRGMAARIPEEYLDGIVEIVVSPRVVPHPDRPEVFTLGHCVPIHSAEGGDGASTGSRVVLYHGSFAALAEIDGQFDWEEEAWETLTHEIRHHVEWRARDESLEEYDAAAEANFARLAGEPFDPLFYLGAERVGEDLYRVDDDWFVDRKMSAMPEEVRFLWSGRGYRLAVPPGLTPPAYLLVEGVPDPPDGDLVVVLRRGPRFRDLFAAPSLTVLTVDAVADQ